MGRVNQLTPDRYLVCGVNFTENTVFISEHNGGGAEGNVLVESPISAQFGQWINLVFDIDGTGIRCAADNIEVVAASTLYFSGAMGFRSFDSSFDAENIEVYAR